ncbi:outer membrane beta-barrel protein [Flavobacterium sp. 3-218]
MIKNIIFFLFSIITTAQTHHTITGVVSSNTNVNLELANIIAKPLQEKASLKFAITDHKGRYRLELENGVDYEINASYIGFIDELFVVKSNLENLTHDFILKPSGENLREIVIKHEYKAIEIKKDTLTFNVKSFANGNERKMKEILEKLPGVEVDKDGTVTVQGKKVTQMLVEGKPFFGGGSKLAVENIPADALDKIEVIDNFNEVGFMKKVSDSEDLAMNVKLKEDKKKFVFGDIEAGLGIGVDKSNLLHSGLFYYSKKLNISFIGDVNNIGKSTFTYSDLRRFTNSWSNYIIKRKTANSLYSLTKDNTDVVENKSQFEAINISFNPSEKLCVSAFTIFSEVFRETKKYTQNEYLENINQTFENKIEANRSLSNLNVSNLKLDYTPDKNQKLFYNTQFQSGTNDLNSILESISNTNSNLFKTINNENNVSYKQYLEWHKNYNLAHTTTFVFNQMYENNKPKKQWLTNKPFFIGLIPLQEDIDYKIEQLKELKTNTIDGVFKHYWIINNRNHLYTNIGVTFENSHFETSEKQILSDYIINDFDKSGFGNKTKYRFTDIFYGLEYKFKIGKWTNKAGLYYHFYKLKNNQIDNDYGFSKYLFQPQWNSDYEFNQSEKLTFSYKLETNFPEINALSSRYTLQTYNLIYKGNEMLENTRYHSFSLLYTKMNMYKGIFWNGFFSYTKKTETIRNEVVVEDINQYNTPVWTNNPENTIFFTGAFTKKIYKFDLKLNANVNWLSYYQMLNNVLTLNTRNKKNAGLILKMTFKKWPNFSFGYEKGFDHFSGLTKSNYWSDTISGIFDYDFLSFWNCKIDYQYLKNSNSNNENNFHEITNMALRYQRKNSSLGLELICNNVFNVQKKNSYFFSDYIISQQATYILPRVLMFSLTYKL